MRNLPVLILVLAIAALSGCSLPALRLRTDGVRDKIMTRVQPRDPGSGDPYCPPPGSRWGYISFWRLHSPFADQAHAEKWSLGETCRAQSEYDDSRGTAPFYLVDSDSPTGWCLCPVRG